jgi:hypothetical protein
MTKSSPDDRNPHPETRSPIADLDLEAQIVLAERAVIARDDRIRRRSRMIVRRVRHGVVRHAGSGAAVAVGTVLLSWLIGRRVPRAPPPPPPTEAEGLARDAGFSLASLLPLVWPLMPEGVRRRVTPTMASTAIAFAAPLFGRLFRRRREAPGR